jgi:TPP-dependent pyruvate/acetoin dehydrogenase alpha subunit|tara:strand:- start:7429 stop:8070 length:642 start_codon:yes stop_codon:yes gene_type:complete
MIIPPHLEKVRERTWTAEALAAFETDIKDRYERATVRGPVHLSGGNEEPLLEIFEHISEKDWVFSSWRNHYHALLHGVGPDELRHMVVDLKKSMSVHSNEPNFYASSIVGGSTPIAIGVAYALKRSGNPENKKVWLFVGDMTSETGIFHEAYKYSIRNDLPIQFVIEDNNQSTNTPTDIVWGTKTSWEGMEKVIYYKYERIYPHHGIGIWVSF